MRSSIMWHYIDEEQEVLSRLIQSDQTDAYAEKKGLYIKAVYFVAHGSSFNAAVSVLSYFAKKAGVRAYAYTPGNFCSGCSPVAMEDPASTLVVVISQTGTSFGAIQALEYAGTMGLNTLSITAVDGSPVALKADHALSLMCGEENSNAKTKGYSATLTLLLQIALSLGSKNGTLDKDKKQAGIDEITRMIQCIPEIYERALQFCRRTSYGEKMLDLYVLGSGINFGTAQEGQLKHMETMCIPTMFNDIGEFSHGMHRSITEKSSVLLIKSDDDMQDLIERSYQYLKGITPHVWMIDATGSDAEEQNRLNLPSFADTQSLLLTTLAIQIMSVYAPELNGHDPNRNAHDDFTIVAKTRM